MDQSESFVGMMRKISRECQHIEGLLLRDERVAAEAQDEERSQDEQRTNQEEALTEI